MWRNEAEYSGVPHVDDDHNGIIDDIYGARWTNGDGRATNGDPMDGYYDRHGTHCAGTIGAVGNNARGVVGVNWTVKLMALRSLDYYGHGTSADAAAALQ